MNLLTQRHFGWLEDQWLEKVAPVTGHASYDEFAATMADCFATEEEEIIIQEDNTRKSVIHRRSSVTEQQMSHLRL
jgi:hypothetical protein